MELQYDDVPQEVRTILDTFNEDADAYRECERITKELNLIGWHTDYDLSGTFTGFWPVRTDILENMIMSWGEADDPDQRTEAKVVEFCMLPIIKNYDEIIERALVIGMELAHKENMSDVQKWEKGVSIAKEFNRDFPFDYDWEAHSESTHNSFEDEIVNAIETHLGRYNHSLKNQS